MVAHILKQPVLHVFYLQCLKIQTLEKINVSEISSSSVFRYTSGQTQAVFRDINTLCGQNAVLYVTTHDMHGSHYT